MEQARRLPEIVIMLKCKEEVSVERNYNVIKKQLKADYEKAMKDRAERIVREREEARAEKLKELQEAEQDEDAKPEEV